MRLSVLISVYLLAGIPFAFATASDVKRLPELTRLSVSAFECAALYKIANLSGHDELVDIAVKSGRNFWELYEKLGRPKIFSEGAALDFVIDAQYRDIVDISPDFHLGHLWSQISQNAHDQVERLKNEALEQGRLRLKSKIAESELRQKNCEWILK